MSVVPFKLEEHSSVSSSQITTGVSGLPAQAPVEIQHRKTYQEIESLRPKEVNGERLCVNCNKPIPIGNEKYCSRQCCIEFFAKNNQAGLRKYVFEREHGKCQGCGYQYPVFPVPFPAKPLMPTFDKPRPEEHDFSGYKQTDADRISHFENQIILLDENLRCSECGKMIPSGSEAYCRFPKRKKNAEGFYEGTYCHSDHCPYIPLEDLSWRERRHRESDFNPYDYEETHFCPVAHCRSVHCIDCGKEELHEIEKDWNRKHRKGLAAFKAAYKAWDAEYTHWAKTVMPAFREEEKRYTERVKQWNHDQAQWKITAEFREFTADHIIPIALGGPEFDLSNIQLLCRKCDKIKTAKDAADIAARRRQIKLHKKYGNQVLTQTPTVQQALFQTIEAP